MEARATSSLNRHGLVGVEGKILVLVPHDHLDAHFDEDRRIWRRHIVIVGVPRVS